MSDEAQSWGRTQGLEQASPTPVDNVKCLALVEVAAFTDVRRRVGAFRADRVINDVTWRIGSVLPEADIKPVGRNLIEVRMLAVRQTGAAEMLARVHAGFQEPIDIDGERLQVAVVIGLAVATDQNVNDVVLVEEAERALNESRDGVDVVVSAVSSTNDALVLAGALSRAVELDELFLQYQPKLHLRRQEIVSVEALIRWQHPQRGLIQPNEFIPAAERSGVIEAMTMWTLRRAIADQRVLSLHGHLLPIYINVAGVLLSNRDFVDEVVALAVASGAKLGFEITETSVIHDPDSAIDHLRRLADIGIEIAIDDYGAGLSSLAYLKKLPARELKIDKLFVTQLTSSHRDPLIVRSTIDLAHALEMEVVAEGVETVTALALLSVMGCDMVQGFLISKPLGLDALLVYLRDDAHRQVCQAPLAVLGRLGVVRVTP